MDQGRSNLDSGRDHLEIGQIPNPEDMLSQGNADFECVFNRFIHSRGPNERQVGFRNAFAIQQQLDVSNTPTRPTPTATTFTGSLGLTTDPEAG